MWSNGLRSSLGQGEGIFFSFFFFLFFLFSFLILLIVFFAEEQDTELTMIQRESLSLSHQNIVE